MTNLIDVYSFGCMINEIMSEKQCYHDYRVTTAERFFFDIRRGLRPTIDKRLPQGMYDYSVIILNYCTTFNNVHIYHIYHIHNVLEVKLLIEDTYKNKRCRPDMKACVEAISTWNAAEWTTIA